jgi:hypothetical protein
MLVVVPIMFHTHNLHAQNLSHTTILLAQVDTDFQSQPTLGSSWKHKCPPPPLENLQTNSLTMKISFLARKAQALNTEP